MAASTPFTQQGFLRYPPDDGEPEADRNYSVQGSYLDKVDLTLNLSGTGTHSVNFGSLTLLGAKAILIEVAAAAPGDTAAPINLLFNGGTDAHEVSQGGFYAMGSPNPLTGILSMDIVYTQNACVKVRILGG